MVPNHGGELFLPRELISEILWDPYTRNADGTQMERRKIEGYEWNSKRLDFIIHDKNSYPFEFGFLTSSAFRSSPCNFLRSVAFHCVPFLRSVAFRCVPLRSIGLLVYILFLVLF